MLLKLGVDISRLGRPMRRQLTLIDNVFQRQDCGEAVITSTYEGTHSASSLHYCNLAIDLRAPRDITPNKEKELIKDLKFSLGNDFDVLKSTACIHIEFDPKGGIK
jgi:hypothetical protein